MPGASVVCGRRDPHLCRSPHSGEQARGGGGPQPTQIQFSRSRPAVLSYEGNQPATRCLQPAPRAAWCSLSCRREPPQAVPPQAAWQQAKSASRAPPPARSFAIFRYHDAAAAKRQDVRPGAMRCARARTQLQSVRARITRPACLRAGCTTGGLGRWRGAPPRCDAPPGQQRRPRSARGRRDPRHWSATPAAPGGRRLPWPPQPASRVATHPRA